MKVGDLVKEATAACSGWQTACVGIITHIDPEEIGDDNEVLVMWNDGEAMNHSVEFLELISESR